MADVYTRSRSEIGTRELGEVPAAITSKPAGSTVWLTHILAGGHVEDTLYRYYITWRVDRTTPEIHPSAKLVGVNYEYTYEVRSSGGNPANRARIDTLKSFIEHLNKLMEDDIHEFAPGGRTIPVKGFDREIHDVPTTNFVSKMRDGKIVNNPVLNRKMKSVVDYQPVADLRHKYVPKVKLHWYVYTDRILFEFEPSLDNATPFYPPSSQEVDEIIAGHFQSQMPSSFFDAKQTAINTAFGNVNSGAFAYLEELGEAKETVAYLASVFKRIGTMFDLVRRGKIRTVLPELHKKFSKKARRRAKRNDTPFVDEYVNILTDEAASIWMELRFAIRPLIFSAEDAIKLHQEGLKSKSGRHTVNGLARSSSSDFETSVSSTDDITRTVSTTIRCNRTARSGVLLQIDPRFADMRTLGFTNLAGTAWELTFLSWAIDYFVNLDGLLYHLTPDIGVQTLTAWSSTDDEIIIETRILQHDAITGELLDQTLITSDLSVYHRQPVDGPGFITLDVDIDIYKLTDLAALFKGLYGSVNKGVIK